jgi:hypothetical protein
MTNVGYFPIIKVVNERDLQAQAEQQFSDIIWSESMVFESFEETDNLTFGYGQFFRIRPGLGMEVLMTDLVADAAANEPPIDPGDIPLTVQTTASYDNLAPTPRSVLDPQAFPANDVYTNPTISGSYDGAYPKDVKLMIAEDGAGDYATATYEVYVMPDISTAVMTGLEVDTWETLTSVSGLEDIQVKWEADPGTDFGAGDAWLVGFRTGNIRSFLTNFQYTADVNTSVTLDVSLDGGATYIEDILNQQQYIEEDAGYGWLSDSSGNDLDWRITISGSTESNYCLLEHLFIFTGDYDAITYWT